MYGLIIEGVRFMIIENFGPQVLTQVLEITQLGEKSISTHDIYSEHIVPNMLRATCEITGMTADQVGVLAGRYFVQFLIRHGYGDLMHVMGRRFSDFLKGLDNIHEYFRFSYPKIRPPSFYCSLESEEGLILHYRSRRQGYISYVIGQLVELARLFYKQDLGVKVLQKKEKGKFLFVVIQLTFNNSGLNLDYRLKDRVQSLNEYLPVDTMSFLKMFPFHIAFNRRLDIMMCGQGLLNIIPQIIGLNMIDVFDLQKPCIKFTAEGCLAHENCNFQLESLHPVVKKTQEEIKVTINGVTEGKEETAQPQQKDDIVNLPYVTLRGPIIYLKSCETFLLLATCVVDGLDDMFRMGLFLNDYGDADCNREIIMASVQKSDHLKNLLQSEKQRSQVLTEMTKEIADNKRKARQLLTQMMPVEVANTLLRTGRSDQFESFECVTVAFVKVVDFPKQTEHMTAVEIVNILNSVYLIFDEIVDLHGVYKVETIGESYMISAGVPYKDDFDTVITADCAIHMIAKIKETDLKFAEGKKLQVKIGIFTGPCVGGIVGHKNPRYCLFGDTVNCASRMETHNKAPMTIQIGQRTKDRLDKQAPNKFKIKHRGAINVKGKGEMKVYEIVGKSGRPRYVVHPPKKQMMKNEDHDDDVDDMSEEHERSSALSRMSLGDSGDSNRGVEEDFDPTALNNSIAEILEKIVATAQFTSPFELQQNEHLLESRNSDSNLIKQLTRQPKYRTVEPVAAPQDKKVEPIRIVQNIQNYHQEPHPALEKEASIISLASSTIQGRNDHGENISLASVSSMQGNNIEPMVDSIYHSGDVNGEQISEEKEGEGKKGATTDFSAEPADKVPIELPVPSKHDHHHDSESTDPEELWRKDESFDVQKKKKKAQKDEMKSTKKILDSQKKKDPELQQKKALPDLKKKEKESRDRPEKRSVKREHEKAGPLRTHGQDDPSCRCEDIREDPKLKTKVCSIQ